MLLLRYVDPLRAGNELCATTYDIMVKFFAVNNDSSLRLETFSN